MAPNMSKLIRLESENGRIPVHSGQASPDVGRLLQPRQLSPISGGGRAHMHLSNDSQFNSIRGKSVAQDHDSEAPTEESKSVSSTSNRPSSNVTADATPATAGFSVFGDLSVFEDREDEPLIDLSTDEELIPTVRNDIHRPKCV
jgi:hypothetical protein